MAAMRICGLAAALCVAHGMVAAAQTPKNPIDPKPEGQAQQNCSYSVTDSSGKVVGTSNCAQSNNALPPSQQFPYPGDTGTQDTTPAGQKFPYPGETNGSATAPSAPPTSGNGKAAAQQFPYPGEGDAAKDLPGDASPLKDAGSSGESSSSSSSSSGDTSSSSSSTSNMGPGDPNDVNSDTPMAPKRNLHKKPAPPPPSVAQQVGEDLQVSDFYFKDKNYMGAYLRAKDAVGLASDDPDAHLALGEAARKLGKLDEALKNFHDTLNLDPVPKTKKAAEQALKEMTGG